MLTRSQTLWSAAVLVSLAAFGAPAARSQTAPQFEILPSSAVKTNQPNYAAYLIDHKNNKLMACVAFYNAQTKTVMAPPCHSIQHYNNALSGNVFVRSVLATQPVVEKNAPPEGFWQIEPYSGKLQFCVLDMTGSIAPNGGCTLVAHE